ncbi:MAG: tRNA-dihydrouridine synthase family protein [bacterium]|nr:tRNA-dihydrouridine synthase family protein [bacterium]
MPSLRGSTPFDSKVASARPAFTIRPAGASDGVPVYGRVFLSPMAGFSDSPYRRICRRQGAGFSFTEFISAENVRLGSPEALALFRFVPEERPILFQIFGNNLAALEYAAQVAEELGPDVLDINMGCSVKTVAHKGSGAGMLRDVANTARIMERLVRAVQIPVTAKIRLGWDDRSRNYRDLTRALVDSGVAMISVHGRTKAMGYTGLADWDAIGEIAADLPIPVLGNGDVAGLLQAREYRRRYGVAGVLIGRAAIGNPWIFNERYGNARNQDFAGESDGCVNAANPAIAAGVPDEATVIELMLEHLDAMLEFYGERGLVLFRKHAARYLTVRPGLARDLKSMLLTATEVEDFRRISLDRLARPGSLNS